ncbi:SCO1860 family LAETG-anchored protein [Kitasatospora sp. NPDC002040]|uniref:SCO1860 family LAETG-anchored protein n=1 Tax=Kitasatospora sp. NPDC002040 TaxID=3154661 RepID=UPI0033327602
MRRSVLRTSAATALTAALLLPGAAHAAEPVPGSPGKAAAVTAELDLKVALVGGAAAVPVRISLNKVESPASLNGSVLTAKVDGVDQGRPVTLVRADVGKSTTRADATGAAAKVELVDADVRAPGLLGAALLQLEALSAEVTCPVDGPPTAKVTSPARISVLGKSVALGLSKPTHVEVPGVGVVDIEFSGKSTTSSTAAASALEVQVDVNPLNLNVAKVSGRITVASVSCEKPVPAPSPGAVSPSAAPTKANRAVPAVATKPGEGQSLAATGSSGTGTVLAASGTLLAVGAVALRLTRRRRAHARRH